MDALFQQLTENLQLIYRKAIDADKAIDDLQRQGKGKFTTIFDADSGFTTRAKRFSPYMEELAVDIQDLKALPQDELPTALPPVVKKIELMFVTLNDFKAVVKT
ncbi:hypothetical protein [Alteromonas oceanisediminis]|uniref:hypothetical protein n=1 Tax=Alteromonas oceanisediminis TaxID=2836180 RepID=UPI001BDB33A8|nr:hypothetical protein [Alteromonas oceanisediminis]MBT0585348.1 hypothetical protein [Alteromonas oceanisediminis]